MKKIRIKLGMGLAAFTFVGSMAQAMPDNSIYTKICTRDQYVLNAVGLWQPDDEIEAKLLEVTSQNKEYDLDSEDALFIPGHPPILSPFASSRLEEAPPEQESVQVLQHVSLAEPKPSELNNGENNSSAVAKLLLMDRYTDARSSLAHQLHSGLRTRIARQSLYYLIRDGVDAKTGVSLKPIHSDSTELNELWISVDEFGAMVYQAPVLSGLKSCFYIVTGRAPWMIAKERRQKNEIAKKMEEGIYANRKGILKSSLRSYHQMQAIRSAFHAKYPEDFTTQVPVKR